MLYYSTALSSETQPDDESQAHPNDGLDDQTHLDDESQTQPHDDESQRPQQDTYAGAMCALQEGHWPFSQSFGDESISFTATGAGDEVIPDSDAEDELPPINPHPGPLPEDDAPAAKTSREIIRNIQDLLSGLRDGRAVDKLEIKRTKKALAESQASCICAHSAQARLEQDLKECRALCAKSQRDQKELEGYRNIRGKERAEARSIQKDLEKVDGILGAAHKRLVKLVATTEYFE